MNEGYAVNALLGAVMQNAALIPSVRAALDVSDFPIGRARTVYRAMISLDDQGIPPDLPAIGQHLLTSGEMEDAGGPAKLAELIDGVPTSDDVTGLIRMVKRLATDHHTRRLIQDAQNALEAGELPADVLAEHLPKLIKLNEPTPTVDSLDVLVDSLGCTGLELATREAAEVDWIVPGYVAAGAVTEIIGRIKEGKTTFAMALVRACLFGGDFIGRYVEPCSAVYHSEQSEGVFRSQGVGAGIIGAAPECGNLAIILKHELSRLPWEQRVGLVMKKAEKVGARVVFWDTFGALAGLRDDGENGDEAGRKMRDLSEAAAVSRRALVVLRHARKSGGDANDAGRGFSGISGAVDIVVLLKKSGSNQGQAVRELEAISRFSETPQSAVIELVGHHYRLLGDAADVRRDRNESAILEALPSEPEAGLTIADIEAETEMTRQTVQRTLADLRERGVVKITGRGTKNDPKRYCRMQKTFCPTNDGHQSRSLTLPDAEFDGARQMMLTDTGDGGHQSGQSGNNDYGNDCAHTIGIVCGQKPFFSSEPIDSSELNQNDCAQTPISKVGTIISTEQRTITGVPPNPAGEVLI